jgi:hypothetical protein
MGQAVAKAKQGMTNNICYAIFLLPKTILGNYLCKCVLVWFVSIVALQNDTMFIRTHTPRRKI